MSRFLIGLCSALFLASAQAQVPVSFERTMVAYEAGNHEVARVSFERMARAGLTEAQFNYGVMLLSAQGGERQLVEGAAWIQLAADDRFGPAQDAVEALSQQLSTERQFEIAETAARLREAHGRRALLERHLPSLDTDGPATASELEQLSSDPGKSRRIIEVGGQQVIIDRPWPDYPREAAQNGIMGVVRLGGWLEPSGEFLHPHVVSAYPEGIFERNALRAFSGITAEWQGEPPERPRYLSQTMTFTLNELGSAPGSLMGSRTLRELRATVEASEDDLAAQHRLIWMIEQLALPDLEPLDPAVSLQITHHAATNGVADAQLDLGRKMMNGNRQVQQDTEGALFWLKQAAFEGHAEAAFELSLQTALDDGFRRDLRQFAIDQGMQPALLAQIRHLVANPDQTTAEEMTALLEQLPRQMRRDRSDPIMSEARRIAGR
jgi:TonB family protein